MEAQGPYGQQNLAEALKICLTKMDENKEFKIWLNDNRINRNAGNLLYGNG